MDTNAYTAQFLEKLIQKDPAQRVFHQAVQEVVSTLTPVLQQNPKYIKERILERITEPERTIIFRVPWQDDKGEIHVNRGFRVQYNSALGPYKGGMRFHATSYSGRLKKAACLGCGVHIVVDCSITAPPPCYHRSPPAAPPVSRSLHHAPAGMHRACSRKP